MIFKIIGLAVIALAASAILKNTLPKLVPFMIFSVGLAIFIFCFSSVKDTLGYFYDICSANKYGDHFKVMLKGLGVAYLSGIGADMCRDCGEAGLAGRIELAAKLEILVITFPLIKSLIELSESILIL
ncbi:MAG: hypothetical protein IJB57_08725 [Clostridia bacterium]|nr:hypothetical protein [Clostridia bacterium]